MVVSANVGLKKRATRRDGSYVGEINTHKLVTDKIQATLGSPLC